MYETSPNGVPGRWAGVQAGVSGNEARGYLAGYSYDGDTGRLEYVTGPGLPATGDNPGAKYLYLADSDLVEKTRFQTADDGILATAIRSYEPDRDLLAGVQNYWGSGTSHLISQYAYVNDDLGLRSSVVRTGDAFDPAHHDDWVYNDRQELLSAYRWETTDPEENEDEVATARRLYTYDAIGNRLTYTPDEQTPATTYTVNNLNAYTATTNPVNTFTYDGDGNLTAIKLSGLDQWTYAWDGENRLVVATPWYAVGPDQVKFTYDYRNRRVRKQVYAYEGQPGQGEWVEQTTLERRYLWDGQRMLAEGADRGNGFEPAQQYAWGLDLAGLSGSTNSLEGAGTIGGLLAVHDVTVGESGADYVYAYDGGGNVGQVVDWTAPTYSTAVMVARYEYDSYGSRTNAAAQGEYAQPFRFGTKYYDGVGQPSDPIGGLYYFGERYYVPKYGRWANQDPLGDAGGANLYAYVGNDPTDRYDAVGYCGSACSSSGDYDAVGTIASPTLPVLACLEQATTPGQKEPPPGPAGHVPLPPYDKPPADPKCTGCWQACIDHLKEMDEGEQGGVLCLPNGCRCACARPQVGPAGSIVHTCLVAAEEWHVQNPPKKTCACMIDPKTKKEKKKPCFEMFDRQTDPEYADLECAAAAVQIDCLCAHKSQCGGDRACLDAIDLNISTISIHCFNDVKRSTINGNDYVPDGAPECRKGLKHHGSSLKKPLRGG